MTVCVIVNQTKNGTNRHDNCSLSRREESWGKIVCLPVCPHGQKTFPTENIKISIFVMNDDLMVVLPLWGQRNIFHKREIIYSSEQLEVADDQLLAVTYNSH